MVPYVHKIHLVQAVISIRHPQDRNSIYGHCLIFYAGDLIVSEPDQLANPN